LGNEEKNPRPCQEPNPNFRVHTLSLYLLGDTNRKRSVMWYVHLRRSSEWIFPNIMWNWTPPQRWNSGRPKKDGKLV